MSEDKIQEPLPIESIGAARPPRGGDAVKSLSPVPVTEDIKARSPDSVDISKPSEEQIAAAKKRARDKLAKQRLDAQLKAIEEEEMQRLRVEEGMVVGGPADEMVSITIDLSEHSACLSTNGRAYWHGHTYTVPRHVADDLRSRMFQGHLHQNQVDGESLTHFYHRPHNTIVSATKGVQNAPFLS